MAGLIHDRNREKRMDKQIGCMSGFLQIFDRQQILAGKRIHSTKRCWVIGYAMCETNKNFDKYLGEIGRGWGCEKIMTMVPAKEGVSMSYQIPVLTPINYSVWAVKVKSIMDAYGLWETVEPRNLGEEPDLKKQKQALAFLFQAIPEEMVLQMSDYTDPKRVWEGLKTRYLGVDRVRTARLATLKRELESLRMKEGETVDDFAAKLSGLASKARSLGHELEEVDLVKRLLDSMPKSFLQIVASIEQCFELDTMFFDEAVGRLKAYEERIKGSEKMEDIHVAIRIGMALDVAGEEVVGPGGAKMGVIVSSEVESSVRSPEFSKKPETEKHVVVVPASPNSCQSSPAENVSVCQIAMPEKFQLMAPMFELKEGTGECSWKSCDRMNRLLIDSISSVADDVDEKQRRSPSVIARLMGLEPLSFSDQKTPQPVAKPALRRSDSDSRVSPDLARSQYIDGNNFQVKQPNQSIVRDDRRNVSNRDMKSMRNASGNLKSESPKTSPWRSRTFFDSADFFPEPNQMTVSMHGDFEKKLKMRGMDEQSNDLGTLKQILEVLQLKGLLHSNRPSGTDSHRHRHRQQNFVYDRNLPSDESSIIVMKPSRSATSKVDNQRSPHDSRVPRRYATENPPWISPKPQAGAVDRSPVRARNSIPNRVESNLKSCNSIVKRKPLSIEIQKRANDSSNSLRTTPINSPKLAPKRSGSLHQSPIHQKSIQSSSFNSPNKRIIKHVVTDDESSSISESTFSTPSTTDTERSKWEGYREGRSSLHRCDYLLHNLRKMNSTSESPPISTTVVPSPVSVLDSVFDKDESSSPSNIIDYKAVDVDFEDDRWSSSTVHAKSTQYADAIKSDDSDFIYISEVLRASHSLYEDPNVFFFIEKHLYSNTDDTSKVSKRRRKLVFDITLEIIDKARNLPPWKVVSFADSGTFLKQIWSEFRKIREVNAGEGDGVLDLISSVLRKDLVGVNDWEDRPIETSETILDIERMIFRDLVSEAIGDLTEFSGRLAHLLGVRSSYLEFDPRSGRPKQKCVRNEKQIPIGTAP
ncbi:hypothetical protein LXL04_036934 [Taraxacum kok-saghyz]